MTRVGEYVNYCWKWETYDYDTTQRTTRIVE